MVKKKKPDGFFDKIKETVAEVKASGEAMSKIAIEKSRKNIESGTEIGKSLAKRGTEEIEKGISSAKDILTSKKEIIELIEMLGQLEKSGVITEKEFQTKKKELLDRI